MNQGVPVAEMDKTLIQLSFNEISKNPMQYAAYTVLESIKLLFWESTAIGFVQYPGWLDQVYQVPLFKNSLRLVLALLSLIGCVYLVITLIQNPLREPLVYCVLSMIVLFGSFHVLFNILPRYVFPVVPLYFVGIGLWVQNICVRKPS